MGGWYWAGGGLWTGYGPVNWKEGLVFEMEVEEDVCGPQDDRSWKGVETPRAAIAAWAKIRAHSGLRQHGSIAPAGLRA